MASVLPLGTVCTLNREKKQIMIIGYKNDNSSSNFYDYIGCNYPNGLIFIDDLYYFNRSDILNVDFFGYKDSKKEEEKIAEYHKKNDMYLTSSDSFSKLLFDENGVVMISDNVPISTQKKYFSDVKFDENGNVISIKEVKNVENPFHKDYSALKEKNSNNNWSIFKNLKFDENGMVISDGINKLHKIEFDENGVVILDNNNIKFSEDGTVLADGTEKDVPPIGPGLPGYKKESKLKFSEDGTVLADGTEKDVPPIGPGLPGYKKESKLKFSEDGMVISE